MLTKRLAATYSTGSSIAASQSSGLINGIATILLTILIDPQIGLLTDKVLKGEKEILVPSAHWINLMVQYI